VNAKRRRRVRRWLIALAALVILALAGFSALPWVLIAPAETAPSDVLLHLAIDPHSDSNLYVAQLYQQGMAKKVVCVSSQVAWETYPADYAVRHLMTLNIPEEDLSALHLPFTDCGAEDVQYLAEYVKSRGGKSALLVVDPSGSRAGRRLIEKYFGRAGIRVAVTYSPRDKQELLHDWWRTHWKAQRIVVSAIGSALDLLYPQCR